MLCSVVVLLSGGAAASHTDCDGTQLCRFRVSTSVPIPCLPDVHMHEIICTKVLAWCQATPSTDRGGRSGRPVLGIWPVGLVLAPCTKSPEASGARFSSGEGPCLLPEPRAGRLHPVHVLQLEPVGRARGRARGQKSGKNSTTMEMGTSTNRQWRADMAKTPRS